MEEKPKNRNRSVRRYILPSDDHRFVGRIFDLSIAGMWFDSYDEVKPFEDIVYALTINERTTALVDRVESLNRVGSLLWPEKGREFQKFPVSRYDWLNIITDLFLVRLISVSDCCLLLSSEVLELGLRPAQCKIANIAKAGAPKHVVSTLSAIIKVHEELRVERNYRVHEGRSYAFTSDDQLFRPLSQMEYIGGTTYAEGPEGERIYLEDLYRAGLNSLRRKFNAGCRILVRALPDFYQAMSTEFEPRFSQKYHSHPHDHPIYGRKG